MMGLLTLPNIGMFLRLKDEVGEPGRPRFKTSCNLPPYRWRESRGLSRKRHEEAHRGNRLGLCRRVDYLEMLPQLRRKGFVTDGGYRCE